MKLSIFTTVTNPIDRGDNVGDSIECYVDLADELLYVDGGDLREYEYDIAYPLWNNVIILKHPWPQEFPWEFIGQQFQRGYEASTGDWVIHADLDFLFHQKDFGAIKQALKDYPSVPAVSFYKWQFILPDRYNLKSRLVLAVNKATFGDRIKFNGGGDLCQPTLDGKDLDLNEIPQAGIPFYNYEKLTKTKSQIMDDVGRMDRAYQRHFGEWLYSEDGTDESAYEGWYRMVEGRFNKPSKQIPLSDHPKYIQDTIRNLTPDQFGYNGFGLIEGKVYA